MLARILALPTLPTACITMCPTITLIGHVECAQLLLKAGACVDTQDMDGMTALHMACICEHPEVAILLLDHGASPDIKDSDGSTPLDNTTSDFRSHFPMAQQASWLVK